LLFYVKITKKLILVVIINNCKMIAFSLEEPTLSTVVNLAMKKKKKKSQKLSAPTCKEPLLTVDTLL